MAEAVPAFNDEAPVNLAPCLLEIQMRKLLVALLLLVVACSASCGDTFQLPRDATLSIMSPGRDFAVCSGVMIAPHFMLTAAHCADESFLVNGAPIKVVRKDDESDVALLKVKHECPCVSVSQAAPALDEPIVVIGFPMNHVVRMQILTEGRAQGEFEDRLRMSAPVAPGNSGGGVFVNRLGRWELVGVVSAMTQKCSEVGFLEVCNLLPHLSYAVTLESIKKILDA